MLPNPKAKLPHFSNLAYQQQALHCGHWHSANTIHSYSYLFLNVRYGTVPALLYYVQFLILPDRHASEPEGKVDEHACIASFFFNNAIYCI